MKNRLLLVFCATMMLGIISCQNVEKSIQQPSSGAAVKGVEKSDSHSVAAENEVYGLALPDAETFRNILQDFIYWEYTVTIEKDGGACILNTLEEEKCLETELKIHLFYQECDAEEMDQAESNFYDVVVTFPENNKLSYFSFKYNARGLSSDYDHGYDAWFSDSLEDDISSRELEKSKWFQKHYTSFGETTLTLRKTEADEYEVKSKFSDGEKERILSAIQKAIKKQYKKEDDLFVYIRDFLPGDSTLSGRVVDLDINDKYDMPLYWVRASIYYSGAKREKFEDVYWDTHYSTAYSGASNIDYDPTLKQVKKWAREEKEAVDIKKCILAYHIKDGEMIDLK